YLATIERVCEQISDRVLVEWFPLLHLAGLHGPGLGRPASTVDLIGHGEYRAETEVEAEDLPDLLRLFLVQHELLLDDVEAEDRNTTSPEAASAAQAKFVPNTLTKKIALVGREGR